MTKKLDLPISPVYYESYRMVFDDPFMMNLYPFDLSLRIYLTRIDFAYLTYCSGFLM